MGEKEIVNVIRRLAVFLSLVSGLSCRPAEQVDLGRVRATLDSLLALHAQHFIAKDIDALASAYTEDAVVRPAGMEPLRGRTALRTALPAWISAAPITALSYTNEDLSVVGDTAFQVVSYAATAQPPDGAVLNDRGHCSLRWIRDANAAWKVDRSLCNSSSPPAQQTSRGGRAR